MTAHRTSSQRQYDIIENNRREGFDTVEKYDGLRSIALALQEQENKMKKKANLLRKRWGRPSIRSKCFKIYGERCLEVDQSSSLPSSIQSNDGQGERRILTEWQSFCSSGMTASYESDTDNCFSDVKKNAANDRRKLRTIHTSKGFLFMGKMDLADSKKKAVAFDVNFNDTTYIKYRADVLRPICSSTPASSFDIGSD